MNKYTPVYINGAIIILSGIFLLFSNLSSFYAIKLTLGISLTIGAVFASLAAISRKRKHIQFAYHEMHALAMLVYGVSVLIFCNTIERLTSFTAFLLVFYSFSEILFCNWLFNLNSKIVSKIIIIRLIIGILVGVLTVVAMNFPDLILVIFGVLFIMLGANIMLYAPIIRESQQDELSNEPSK